MAYLFSERDLILRRWRSVSRTKALCFVYPSLFNLALHKEATVTDMWDRGRGEGCWSPTFLRSLNDWEIEEMKRFLRTLYKQNFSLSGEDKLLLKDVREEGFSIKLMYKGLDPSLAMSSPFVLYGTQLCLQK